MDVEKARAAGEMARSSERTGSYLRATRMRSGSSKAIVTFTRRKVRAHLAGSAIIPAAFLLSLIVPTAWIQAGDYHTGATLDCGVCHTMHYSISHTAHQAGIHDNLGAAGPYRKLLRDTVNNLCLMCHDGRGGGGYGWPDVMGAPSNLSLIRESGMLNQASSAAPYEHWKGHTLGSTATAPGGTFSNSDGLNCIDCHMPHGDVPEQYRNLRVSADPGDKFYIKSITYATMTNDLSKDVFQRTPSVITGSGCTGCHAGHGSNNRYAVTDISFNEPDPKKSAMGDWCMSCHSSMHGPGGAPNMGGASGGDNGTPWLRHPTADVDIGANSDLHSSYPKWSTGWSSTTRVQTMSASGTYPARDNTPSCMSCHRAHGSVNPFGLVYTNPDGTLAIESAAGGASIQSTCNQCHEV